MPRARGRLTPWPMRVPIRLAAKAITGIGDVAGAMLANPQIEGWLSDHAQAGAGATDLKLTSAKWNGKLSLLIDLVTGRFDVSLSGAMQRYLIPGIGIVDVITDLKVVPGPNGHGSHVVGTAKAWVRRLDNSFFREPHRRAPVADDQPRARQRRHRPLHQPAALFAQAAAVGRRPALQATALSTSSPPGGRRNTVRVKLVLDGHIERPRLDIFLDRPNDTLGITAMHLALDPIAAGYNYKASGGSRLGPFTSNGQILLPHDAPTVIAIAALDAGGAHASGDLTSMPGGLPRPADARQRHARRNARLLAGRAGAADRRAPHRRQCGLPRRFLGAQRTRRRHDHPRRRQDDRRRQSSTRAASTSGGGDARAAHRQCEAGQRQRAGPRRLRRPPRRGFRLLDSGRRLAGHDPADRQAAGSSTSRWC